MRSPGCCAKAHSTCVAANGLQLTLGRTDRASDSDSAGDADCPAVRHRPGEYAAACASRLVTDFHQLTDRQQSVPRPVRLRSRR
jgi:hypothetical protein